MSDLDETGDEEVVFALAKLGDLLLVRRPESLKYDALLGGESSEFFGRGDDFGSGCSDGGRDGNVFYLGVGRIAQLSDEFYDLESAP